MKEKVLKTEDTLAEKVTRSVGSVPSLILHTLFFILCLVLPLFGFNLDQVLLFLTTLVSLEAIYLSILIQYSVNQNTKEIEEVGKDIDEIQEDIDEIQEDVEEIEENVDEIQEDIDEIQEDVDEIQEDIDEIQEDVEEIEEGSDEENTKLKSDTISRIEEMLSLLQKDIEVLKNSQRKK